MKSGGGSHTNNQLALRRHGESVLDCDSVLGGVGKKCGVLVGSE